MHRYTDQDVRDAYFAELCAQAAKVEKTSPEEEATHYYPEGQHQVLLDSLHRGQDILKSAKIVRSERRTFQQETLQNIDSPIIFWDSGYLAASQTWIEVALKMRRIE
jgi:hypothetical protein